MENQTFDVAVIGLGAVGTATLYQLSKTGAKVLGIDRFAPPHILGSSHGETRITRLAVGEGEEYVALAKRSHEIWEEIESISGQQIKTRTGGLLIDSGVVPWSKHGSEGFWDRTVRFAHNQGIEYRIPTLEEVEECFPAFEIPATGKVYQEKEAGFLRPELAIQTQLALAQQNGAEIWTHSPVLSIKEEGDSFLLELENRSVKAKKIVLATGGWIKDFLSPEEKSKFKICRQVLHWLEIEPGVTDWTRYPVWMWGFGPHPEDFIYGFPSLDGLTVKMASESFVEVEHPDRLVREVSAEEQEMFWEAKVEGKVKGLKKSFVKSSVCFYTVTEDARFVLEPMRGNPNFLWVSACSGHGFKHSAALGEVLSRKILGL
ncbi:N-methyl-L-tryptophan oxidase [Algoriphagus sp. AK58]|uniref:N-methyl-L-tryptophan oxidase n=1 Tax=Algoriphagus sp. AK58 TaxID=1406877 RepID=UPI00164EE0C9|nr:N-methyl-L-tryptophan oxidase [Algoriphagus sp. AK58]MBC6365508.1 N-methyl-L-tryptophan oxidase [Algoriphagus sp. AK58]